MLRRRYSKSRSSRLARRIARPHPAMIASSDGPSQSLTAWHSFSSGVSVRAADGINVATKAAHSRNGIFIDDTGASIAR